MTEPTPLPGPLPRYARPLRWAYLALGVVCVALGIIGVIVPGMPTTVFLIVALWAFARSSPRLHVWLLDHPRLGPPLRAWQNHRVVPRRAKILATGMMATSIVILWFTSRNPWLTGSVAAVLAGVSTYLLTRPSQPPPDASTPQHSVR
jgi:uncharacterized protein